MTTTHLDEMPRRVKAFGKLWAMKFIATHPNWKKGEAYTDEWYDFMGYDLNLWCEDGYLSVCAYATFEVGGLTLTDTSDFTYIVRMGNMDLDTRQDVK